MNPFQVLRTLLWQYTKTYQRIAHLERAIEQMREALGRIEARQSAQEPAMDLRSHEFKVYSQWGEDGIIDHLVRHVPIARPFFVEFGVEDYSEANTRFLLTHQGWRGLLIEADPQSLAKLRQEPLMWRNHLAVVEAFVTRENINQLLSQGGAKSQIGLLSIDIDGNDYWIWEAITVVTPDLVIVEYNGLFGVERAVTVPYDQEFRRDKAHYSHLYMGASLRAMVQLGNRKGYAFVGTNQAGNNAFFVRREVLPASIRELSVEEGFRAPKFREARNADGTLAFLSIEDAAELIKDLPLVEVGE